MFDDPRWDDSRDREYMLRGFESPTLSIVGAFRVVSSRDLLDHHNGRLTRVPATSDTFASRGSSEPFRSTATAMSRSC